MNWLNTFIFDPLMAAIAKATSSGAAPTPAGQPAPSPNSPAAATDPVIAQLEADLQAAVDKTATALLNKNVVTEALEPEEIRLVNMGLTFLEQHAGTYLAALFSHVRGQVTTTQPPAQPLPQG